MWGGASILPLLGYLLFVCMNYDSSETDSRSSTPSDVKSTPFVLTSTNTYPANDDAVLLHTSDVSPTYCARAVVVLNRQSRYPSDSETAEKPLPDTVTGVTTSLTAA